MISAQAGWDLAAIASCTVSGSYIYTRRQMLSGAFRSWHTASALVQGLLALQAIWMGYVAVVIGFGGGHVTPREAITYLISAAVSAGLQRNLERHGKLPPEPAR